MEKINYSTTYISDVQVQGVLDGPRLDWVVSFVLHRLVADLVVVVIMLSLIGLVLLEVLLVVWLQIS